MQTSLWISRFSIKTYLAVAMLTSMTALSGCATTGAGSSGTVAMRDFECKPLSPNSNIVSITYGGGGGFEAYIHVKRQGEAVGTFDTASRDLNNMNQKIFLLHPNDEKIQCRQL